MESFLTFYDKTLENTKQEISNFEKNLKSSLKNEEFNEIEKTVKDNEEATKVVLERHKFKKFSYLKHNPQKRPITIAEDNVEQQSNS